MNPERNPAPPGRTDSGAGPWSSASSAAALCRRRRLLIDRPGASTGRTCSRYVFFLGLSLGLAGPPDAPPPARRGLGLPDPPPARSRGDDPPADGSSCSSRCWSTSSGSIPGSARTGRGSPEGEPGAPRGRQASDEPVGQGQPGQGDHRASRGPGSSGTAPRPARGGDRRLLRLQAAGGSTRLTSRSGWRSTSPSGSSWPWSSTIGSRRQDETGLDRAWPTGSKALSAPGLVLYFLTTSFALIDWGMSLEPELVLVALRRAPDRSARAVSTMAFMILRRRRDLADGARSRGSTSPRRSTTWATCSWPSRCSGPTCRSRSS